jgi:hypothetical protein
MAAAAQALKNVPWDEAALQALAPVAAVMPYAGLDALADHLQGSHLFEFREGGQHALLALRGAQLAGGAVLEVVAMRSLGARLQSAPVLAALETTAHQAFGDIDLLSFTTRRPHMVRAAVRAGWATAGVIVTKNIRAH